MKKPISLAMALALCAGLTIPAQAAFSDVPNGLWSASAIQAAADQGIVAGFPDGTFHPNDDVTNVQFSVMLYHAFYPSATGEETGFTDWYMPAMEALSSENVYKDVSFTQKNGSFDWDAARANTGNPMSRYDMAQLLANIIAQQGKTVTDEEKTAAQAAISDWSGIPAGYRDAVAACYAAKMIGGMPDGSFSGNNVMDRAQACVVIGNLSSYLSAAPVKQAPDAPETTTTPSTPSNTTPSPANNTNNAATPRSRVSSSSNSDSRPSSSFEREERSSSFSDFLHNRANENTRAEEESTSEPSTGRTPRPETPSTPETPASTGTLSDGSEITEENVLKTIEGLKSEYPDGRSWSNSDSHFSKALRTTGYGCAGFALICSDAAFGNLPVSEEHSDFSRIRVGDMLRVDNDTHSVVVLEKKSNSVIVAEGNYTITINGVSNGPMIHWGREISRSELEAGNFTVQTRYPK